MKLTKKLLIALLMTSIAFSALTSCKTGNAENENATSEKTSGTELMQVTDTELKDAVPDMNFNGETFNILIPDMNWATSNILSEEINSEIVNDAQYLLKTTTEERFNVVLKETKTGNIWSTSYISNLILSDDGMYDLFFSLDSFVLGYAQQKLIYNWDELVYVDLTQPYWYGDMNKNLTINNNTYFAFGAYDLSYYDLTHVLVFNKNMIQDYAMDSPYDLVRDNKWTFDKFYDMAKETTFSVSGNDTMGVDDSYGMISVAKHMLPCFWIAAGELSVAKDANDYPYFNVPGNERFYTIVDKVFSMMWDGGIWCKNTEIINFWPNSKTVFSDNRALFAEQSFYFLNEFRNIETDFGIIPYPKLTEDQDQYYSRVEGGCKMPIVPITNKSPEKAGAILEALACEAYKTVIPEYYEVALKRKNSRDEESEEMLDLIFNTRVYDLGDSWWCVEFRDGVMAKMFMNNDRNLVSKIDSMEDMMKKSIEKTVEGFKSN